LEEYWTEGRKKRNIWDFYRRWGKKGGEAEFLARQKGIT